MSSSLVRKSFMLIESDFKARKQRSKKKKSQVPANHKITKNVVKRGKHVSKVNVLSSQVKTTVEEIRKSKRTARSTEETLLKLRKLREKNVIQLNKDTAKSIIKRAVTRRPVKEKKQTKSRKTAFTEEDFKEFETQYLNE